MRRLNKVKQDIKYIYVYLCASISRIFKVETKIKFYHENNICGFYVTRNVSLAFIFFLYKYFLPSALKQIKANKSITILNSRNTNLYMM